MMAITRSQAFYSCISQTSASFFQKSVGVRTLPRQGHCLHRCPSRSNSTSSNNKGDDAQQRAYAYYQRQRTASSKSSVSQDIHQRNVRIAMYASAVVIGALGATYASVPLYKIFCQMTGFGGTTQRVRLFEDSSTNTLEDTTDTKQALWNKLVAFSNIPLDMLPKSIAPAADTSATTRRGSHVQTWTDEDALARLAALRPVANGRLITIRFDSTVGDILPWTFRPTQLDVKVVPGETALSFFTATNHSSKAITGVATYNVHPPRAGLYFNKIQCFCFEEQRLLPGETVDMPVFFFIDPEYIEDPQLSKVNHITLSYTFFQTDVDDDDVEVEKPRLQD